MNLLEKLKAALALSHDLTINEFARLSELHDLLCECVGALDTILETHGCDQTGCVIKWRKPTEALSRLESYLEKREGAHV